jgi:uncharacterized membrane protein (DUF106 family)
MARSGAATSVVQDDPSLSSALETVLDRTESGEPISWADVSGDLSSGEWGRLIEAGVLEAEGDGFQLADRDDVEAALADDTGDIETPEASSWTQYDKAAAAISIALFAGYSLRSVRDPIGRTVDVVLGPLNDVLPFYAVVLVLALVTGLYSALLQSNLMDAERLGQYQERMKDIQRRRKEAKERGDDAALEQIKQEQMEAAGDQLGMFKEQFRPTVWIMLLTIPLFLWMYWMILDGHIAEGSSVVLPLIGEATWTRGVLGPIQAWILWYFLCSMGFSQLLRKSMDIQMTPG